MSERYTMLVIAHLPEERAALQAYFSEAYDLCFAESGGEALTLLSERAVDVVALVMSMPGMDGFELLGRLRADPAFTDLPVVAVTPTDVALQRRALMLGADGFITLDYDPMIVRTLVKNIVDKYIFKVLGPKKQLAYEHIINECLKRAHSTENLSESVTEIIAITGRYMGADRAYAFEARGDAMVCAFEWCAPDVPPLNATLHAVGMDVMRRWEAVAAEQPGRGYLLVEDREEIRARHPLIYARMCEQGLTGVVQMQIRVDGKLRALIGFDNPTLSGEELRTFLDNVFYFIDISIDREVRRVKMLQMTYHDPLTRLFNRAAFYRDIERWEGGYTDAASAGIFYIDLNGLKQVNDLQSHAAGDALLVLCAARLRECIPDGAAYRVGGDEFVVIAPDMSNADFSAAIGRLREKFSGESDCRGAIGASLWLQGADFRSCITAADHAMYRDKAEYYKLHDRRPRRESDAR